MLPSTDNTSWLSSVNTLVAGPCLAGKKKKRLRKISEHCFLLFFHFQKLGLTEAGGCWTMM